MAEESKKNTIWLVAMIFSIIGAILFISIIWTWLGIVLLLLGFILGIIWLFIKPRGKAITAVVIPLVITALTVIAGFYVWNSAKAPATEFLDWFKNIPAEYNLSESELQEITNSAFESVVSNFTANDLQRLYDIATWNNAIEKWTYVYFSLARDALENKLDSYEKVSDEDENIEDTEWLNEENNEPENTEEENNEIEPVEKSTETTEVEPEETTEPVIEPEETSVFTAEEQEDIADIIEMLE